MHARILLIIIAGFFNLPGYTQVATTGSIQIEHENKGQKDTIVADSLALNEDSLIINTNRDTILTLPVKNDSILENNFTEDSLNVVSSDTVLYTDTIYSVVDTSAIKKIKTYGEVMDYVNDSLFFEEPDTVHYVIYNLNLLLNSDLGNINDTTRQAIYKLMEYSKNLNIEQAIDYLQHKMKQDSIIEYNDSTIKTFRDSVFHAVSYLLKSIPEDSVKFSFRNLGRDSVMFRAAEHEADSVRLNLFDNRGEEAVLWIKKSKTSTFDIYLEDGIYIEKARQQKVVNPELKAEFSLPELKKVKKTVKIIPIWDFEGLADIKFNQGHISESWAEGGESSISTLSVLKYSADYSYGKIRNLDTDVEYRLGYLKAGDNEMKKNDDKFELNVKYGKQAFNNWYYSSLLNFRTQFFKGKEYVNDSTVNTVSNFLSPAYLVFSLGLDYKPSAKLTVLLSPLTSKFTIVADTVTYNQTRFGVGQNEKIRKEVGAYVKAISKLKFRDNITLENKVNFFTNYTHNPQNIDIDWELNLAVQLTDYIKMSVNTRLVYDDDVTYTDSNGEEKGPRIQFKELFGIGFTYSF